jgi:DNA-binding transcriptional LysR family regulator
MQNLTCEDAKSGRMSSETFSWDDLKVVLAVAEARGLGPAAERLGLDGSTVFRRLGQIEARLGQKLFERHRSGYVPTPAGAEMAALAARVEEDVAALSMRLSGQAPEAEGEIRVTTNDTLLLYLLTPIFAAFRKAHPAMRLDIVLANEALNLARRDADVAIRATEEPPENLVGRRLATVAWALYARADEVAAIDLEALPERNWVTLSDGFDAMRVVRFVRDRVPPERIVYKVNTVIGLAGAVEAGIGIGALPCLLADRMPALVRLAPPDPSFATALWLLTHPHLRHAPRVRAFMDFVAAEISPRRALLAGEAAPQPAP